jgi:glycosyltransferase involved in cell wall biosynthesis
MKTVLLRAPLLTKSGYGVHSRQIARWLFSIAEEKDLDITCECLPWGITPWITDTDAEDGLIGQIIQSTTNVKPMYDVSLQLQLPNEWNPFIADTNIGITAGVETDVCNKEWINCINRMQKVIVPSEFTKKTFQTTGKVTADILVIPEAFPDIMLEQGTIDLQLKTKFNFLIVAQLTGNSPENDRKGTMYAMKWFMEAFEGNPNVGLVVKTSMFRQTHLDRTMTANVFNRLLINSGLLKPGGPKLYLLHGDMTDEEMNGLYSHPDIKALLALTHGEGFGLPILEAGVKGLPVIGTNWSAHTEFLKPKKWLPVNYKIDRIDPSRVDNQIFFQEAKWAYADEQDAKKRMLKFYDSPQIPQQWAKEMAVDLKRDYSFANISGRYTEALKELF